MYKLDTNQELKYWWLDWAGFLFCPPPSIVDHKKSQVQLYFESRVYLLIHPQLRLLEEWLKTSGFSVSFFFFFFWFVWGLFFRWGCVQLTHGLYSFNQKL